MMTARMMFTVLLALAVGASSATVGYAGGGAGGTGGVTIFQCWDAAHGQAPHLNGTATAGAKANTVLNVNDQFTNATNEELGKLKMVCSPTTTSITSPSGASFDANHDLDAHLACYLVDDAHASPPSTVTVSDAFDLSKEGPQTVTVQGESKFLCVFAHKACVSGGCTTMGGAP